MTISLVEFPADDASASIRRLEGRLGRALKFWSGVLGAELEPRNHGEGEGWQTHDAAAALGLHRRGPGPGDRVSLPYFSVPDLPAALARVEELGGSIVHPGPRWAICRDSEGSPFGLTVAG